MWQKCPICNGTGLAMTLVGSNSTCPTCNGARIISELNGLPPMWNEKVEQPKINGRQKEVCTCGHTREEHYNNEGQCHDCGCTWFYKQYTMEIPETTTPTKKKKSRK